MPRPGRIKRYKSAFAPAAAAPRGARRRPTLVTPHPNSTAARKWKMRGAEFISYDHDDARTAGSARLIGLNVRRP